jgi:hypothetical protein
MSGFAHCLGTLAVLAGTASCGAEVPSSAWVREPESGGALGDEELALERHVNDTYTSSAAPKSGPQRLDRTITLGSVVDTSRGPAPASAAPGSPAVTIQVNNYVQRAAYGYVDTPTYAPAPSAPNTPARGSGGAGVQPGQNYPAPVSHGPAFPFQASPASPWESQR